MKKIHKLFLASAAATMLLTGCAEDYKSDFNPAKPESVALADSLNAYDVLKNYTGIHLGAELACADVTAKKTLYSQVISNFNELTLSDAFSHAQIVSDAGVVDTLTMEDAVTTAAAAGLNVFGTAMFDPAQFNLTYMGTLTKDTWVEGSVTDTDYLEDFEKYSVGSKFDGDEFSVIADDPAGQSGKVFSNTKNVKFMSVPVQLPEGATLNDVKSISFDYRTSKTNKNLSLKVKIGNSVVAEKDFGKPETTNTWTNYQLDTQKGFLDNATSDNLAETSFTLIIGQGATPQKVYVDNIKLHISYKTDGYYVTRPTEEKAADVLKGMNNYANALVAKYGDQIQTWTVAANLLDDLFGELKSTDVTGDPTEFYPNDYLGDNYIVDVCKNIHAVKPNMQLFYEENNILGNEMKLDGLTTYLSQWNAEGAQIAGVNIQVDFPYNEETLEETKANYEAMLNTLKETGLLVRLSDLNVYPADESGIISNISQVTTQDLKSMAVFYDYIVSKYLEVIPQNQQYGISFADINTSSLSVGMWSNYNRLPTYVGVANGLQSKETIW